MASSVVRRSPRLAVCCGVLGLVASLLAVGAAPPAGGVAGEADHEPLYQACLGPALVSQGLVDVVGSFAEDAVNCMAHFGVTKGRTETLYDPGAPVLRWQMALFLSRAAPSAGIVLPAQTRVSFTDTGEIFEEARTAIHQMAELEIMPGFAGSVFSPYVNVTRAQMAQMLDVFLSKAALGTGALGGDVDGLSDVSPDDEVFGDIGNVTRGEYSAIRRMFEAGVTRGASDDQFNPSALVTRAQMAVFITRMLAHTVARPAGLTLQAAKTEVTTVEDVELAVSVRGTGFAGVPDASVDVFYAVDAGEAFGSDGRCLEDSVTAVTPGAACEITVSDEVTDPSGDLLLTLPRGDDSRTVWAWTGDVRDVYDSMDTAASVVEISVTKPGTKLLVTDDMADTATALAFGASVTFTVQVVDEDGEAVALEGVGFGVNVRESVLSGADGASTSMSSSSRSYKTDEDGKVEFSFRQTDPRSRDTGDRAWLDLDIGRGSLGNDRFELDDMTALEMAGVETGFAVDDAAVVWQDAAAVPSVLKMAQAVDYGEASAAGRGGANTVTATLTDQYGDPIGGKRIQFFSDTSCTPAAGETSCTVLGIGAEGTGATRLYGGEARWTRTTSRSGRASLSYTYDSDEGVIETIWAAYTLTGTEGVRGVADSSAGRGAADPDDLTALTADPIYFYWTEDPVDLPATGRILLKDTENDRLVAAVDDKVVMVEYDPNDQFNGQQMGGAISLADFEKLLADNANPPAAHLQVDVYETDSRKVSSFTLAEEWSGANHPDGPAEDFSYPRVAADNGVMVVGAPFEGGAGMVYIYPNGPDTSPSNVIRLTSPAPTDGGRFGHDVDIEGDTVVVGGMTEYVYIYVRSGGTWPTSPTATFFNGTAIFGQGVALSADGSTLAMLLIYPPIQPLSAGDSAQVAVVNKPSGGWADATIGWNNAAWLRDRTDIRELDGTPGSDGWGDTPPVWHQSIAVSGDGEVVISGSCNYRSDFTPLYSCPGAVNVWVRPGDDTVTAWPVRSSVDTVATLLSNGGDTEGREMAKYVGIDDAGDTIVAGGHFDGAQRFSDPGMMFVFTKPDGGWGELDNDTESSVVLRASKARPHDVFGQYIAVSGDGSEIVASRHWRQEGDRRGSVVTFRRPSGGWAGGASPDAEFLGPFPEAHIGWATTYDRTSGDIYTAMSRRESDRVPESSAQIWKITR